MNEFERLKSAVNDSVELWKLGDEERALKLLDDAITIAIQEGTTGGQYSLYAIMRP